MKGLKMNKKTIKEIWINLNWIRTIFILIGYFFITNKEVLRLDIEEMEPIITIVF